MAVVVTKQRTIAPSTRPLPLSGLNPNTHSIQSGRMGVMTEKTPLAKAKHAVTQNRRLTILVIAASISPLSRTGCLRPLGALSPLGAALSSVALSIESQAALMNSARLLA